MRRGGGSALFSGVGLGVVSVYRRLLRFFIVYIVSVGYSFIRFLRRIDFLVAFTV